MQIYGNASEGVGVGGGRGEDLLSASSHNVLLSLSDGLPPTP